MYRQTLPEVEPITLPEKEQASLDPEERSPVTWMKIVSKQKVKVQLFKKTPSIPTHIDIRQMMQARPVYPVPRQKVVSLIDRPLQKALQSKYSYLPKPPDVKPSASVDAGKRKLSQLFNSSEFSVTITKRPKTVFVQKTLEEKKKKDIKPEEKKAEPEVICLDSDSDSCSDVELNHSPARIPSPIEDVIEEEVIEEVVLDSTLVLDRTTGEIAPYDSLQISDRDPLEMLPSPPDSEKDPLESTDLKGVVKDKDSMGITIVKDGKTPLDITKVKDPLKNNEKNSFVKNNQKDPFVKEYKTDPLGITNVKDKDCMEITILKECKKDPLEITHDVTVVKDGKDPLDVTNNVKVKDKVSMEIVKDGKDPLDIMDATVEKDPLEIANSEDIVKDQQGGSHKDIFPNVIVVPPSTTTRQKILLPTSKNPVVSAPSERLAVSVKNHILYM